jgi:hypothetical protein
LGRDLAALISLSRTDVRPFDSTPNGAVTGRSDVTSDGCAPITSTVPIVIDARAVTMQADDDLRSAARALAYAGARPLG